MAMPYKKDNDLCSPTSALEKELMLSRLGEELRSESEERFLGLTDTDKLI